MSRLTPTIDAGLRPWLLVSALLVVAPHIQHQPIWMTALLAGLLAWSLWLWRQRGELPGRAQRILLVIMACAATFSEYRTLLGRDPGVSLLIVFMAMKLLETRHRRDVHVVVALGYFLLLTHYFHDQGLLTGAWLLVSLLVLSATLVRLHAGPMLGTSACLRVTGKLLLQALPFMLLLFVLFPRVSGPLWGLPSDAHKGQTGLSDEMSPGSISELVQNGDIAFRVRFAESPPGKQQLYWRGPVLERFDGRTWRPDGRPRPAPKIEPLTAPIRYETTLEPHQQRWLLALDAPQLATDSNFSLNGVLTASNKTPIRQRTRFSLAAVLDYRFNALETPETLGRNQQLPPQGNPRTRALASEWRQAGLSAERTVDAALKLFSGNGFSYTLRPPLLGENGIDEFLLSTRQGFCEHYAGAFVFLMRAAGIPARVVTGYQGGEVNPVDGYLVVRQSDAHAWAEVWLENRGWVRVDPTSVVAPSRLENGIANALGAGEPLPALLQVRTDWVRLLRYRWEALNNAWNQYVIGYNQDRQRSFLQSLGLPDPDWRQMATLLGIGCTLLLGVITALILRQKQSIDPAVRLWRQALGKLRRHRVHCAPGESPSQLLNRVEQQHPDLAPALAEVVSAYLRCRYGNEPAQITRLREAIARLP